MDNLSQQTQVINLGKLLVKELGLEDSTDTLSKWMAHYIAEQLQQLEGQPQENDSEPTKKECFEIILALWKHRWILPFGKRPLEDFEPILKTLQRLSPENEEGYYFRDRDWELTTHSTHGTSLQEHMDAVLLIDKVARIWIHETLEEAASLVSSEDIKETLTNAVAMPDNDDVKVIEILLDDDPDINLDNYQDPSVQIKYQWEKLHARIVELEKFAALNQRLLDKYKSALTDFEKRP